MDQHTTLVLLAIVSIVLLIIIVIELSYVIYTMNSNASIVGSTYRKNHKKSRLEEHFNPERNYPQPPNSILKDSTVGLYYAAGNTETLNQDNQMRDEYYVKHAEHY